MKYTLIIILINLFSVNLIAQEFEKLINQAQECYQNKDLVCSENTLLKAIKLMPKNYMNTYFLYANLSNTQAFQGKTKEALKSIGQAIKYKNDIPQLYYNRARLNMQRHKFKLAIKDCDKAISLDEHNSEAYVTRGDAYARMDKYDNAKESYFHALNLDPENTKASFNLAYCYIKSDSLDKALELFNQLIAKYETIAPASKLAQLYNNRADVHLKMENLNSAVDDIKKAIELDENFKDSYVTYGEYGLAIENYNLACENFKKAIELGFDKNLIQHYLKKCE